MRHVLPVALGTTVIVGALAGCTATPTPVPDARALVGTWRAEGSEAGVLVLRSGGRCTATLLTTGDGVAAGDCTWRVGSRTEGARAGDGSPLVELDFSGSTASTVGLTDFRVEGAGDSVRLWVPVGDPDQHQRSTLVREPHR